MSSNWRSKRGLLAILTVGKGVGVRVSCSRTPSR